jgi:hypothetical protein
MRFPSAEHLHSTAARLIVSLLAALLALAVLAPASAGSQEVRVEWTVRGDERGGKSDEAF